MDSNHGHDSETVEVDHEQEQEAENLAIGRATAGQPQVEREDERQAFDENASEGGSYPHLSPVLALVRHYVVNRQEEHEASARAEHHLEHLVGTEAIRTIRPGRAPEGALELLLGGVYQGRPCPRSSTTAPLIGEIVGPVLTSATSLPKRVPLRLPEDAGVAQLAEQLFCKQAAVAEIEIGPKRPYNQLYKNN